METVLFLSFPLFLLACSENQLFWNTTDPDAGPPSIDLCRFPVNADDGSVVEMRNEFALERLEPSSLQIEPGPKSEIAKFRLTVLHPKCPALTVVSASMIVEGSDEGSVGWPENLIEFGGVALQNSADHSAAGLIIGNELEVDYGPYGDIFEWDGDIVLGLVIDGGDSVELSMVIDTTGASSGEESDSVYGRFGWLTVDDGSESVSTITNYEGPVVEIQ